MQFEPYTLAMDPISMTIVYLLREIGEKLFASSLFDRELFKVKDGGTLGLDWDQ